MASANGSVADGWSTRQDFARGSMGMPASKTPEGTLELAAVLADERKLMPDHREFSRWLERNGLAKIDAHDRAALIGMAADLVTAREMLNKTQRTSWREIWRNERPATFDSPAKGRQAPAKRKSAEER